MHRYTGVTGLFGAKRVTDSCGTRWLCRLFFLAAAKAAATSVCRKMAAVTPTGCVRCFVGSLFVVCTAATLFLVG